MSLGTHFRSNANQILIETEGTPGSAETLVAGDIHDKIGNAAFTLDAERVENELQNADLSPEPDFQGVEPCTINFFHYLRGSGDVDTPPGWGEFFIHAGFTETVNASTSVVYTPDSSFTTNPATMALYKARTGSGNGKRYLAKGCRAAEIKLIFEVGKPVMVEHSWRGALESITDGALFTSAAAWHDGAGLDATKPQRATNLNFSLGGWSPRIKRLEIVITCDLVPIEDAGAASNPSGLCGFEVANRTITGTLELKSTPVSDKDVIADLRAAGTGSLELTLGSATGNTIVIAGPAVQINGLSEADDEGLMASTFPLKFCRGAAGDDELSITCS